VPPRAASSPAHPPVGIILAGGASTRFGAPKGLAVVGGVRIVDRVARALRDAGGELLLVANDSASAACLPGVPCIPDRIPGGGGLSGVHAALVHTGRAALVVAWDMPFVTAPLLRALWRRYLEAGADACFPESASPVGMEPFCACYGPGCIADLETALRAGDFGGARFARSLKRAAWLSAAEVAALGDPARLLLSVNSQADLARAEAMAVRQV